MTTCCFRKHRLDEDVYRCQYNLAGIYQRTGNLSQALRHVDVAIKCTAKTKDKLAEREALILKGKVSSILANPLETSSLKMWVPMVWYVTKRQMLNVMVMAVCLHLMPSMLK